MSKRESSLSFEAMAQHIDNIPEDYALIGSVARCALMRQLDIPINRADGSIRDIDVLPTQPDIDFLNPGVDTKPFRFDTGLGRYLHPIDPTKWGLFVPTAHDLFPEEPDMVLDGEQFEPISVSLSWNPEVSATVLPPAIQREIIGLYSGYVKNRAHVRAFMRWSDQNATPLHQDTLKTFLSFRNLYSERYKAIYSKSERAYRVAQRNYRSYAPTVIQSFVEPRFAKHIKRMRGTYGPTTEVQSTEPLGADALHKAPSKPDLILQ